MSAIRVRAVAGVGEVAPGTDLAALLAPLLLRDGLRDGDVVVVTSKVVSKAEGRVREGAREDAVPEETTRVLARRGPTTIARTRHGLVLAAAGVDASNVPAGHVVLLPLDPDGSARTLRRDLRRRTGRNVAVVLTDTAGRAWRTGQTDVAIGAAGLLVADDHAGRHDAHGNPLAVTLPALADEVAGAADLVTGKLGGLPVAVVEGLGHLVLDADDDGPGAVALVRPEGEDMFGLGSREAVLVALAGAPDPAFGVPAARAEVHAALERLRSAGALPAATSLTGPDGPDGPEWRDGIVLTWPGADPRAVGGAEAVLAAVAVAHGWSVQVAAAGARLSPGLPGASVDSP